MYKKKKKPKEVFELTGPVHLTSVNWSCIHYQRSVVASLVRGSSVAERDRQNNRKDSEACAPAWWNFFHFQLYEYLFDDVDNTIFGAIFVFKDPLDFKNSTTANAPKFIIAFRGTLLKSKSICRDLELITKIGTNSLHKSSRFEIAMQAVHKIVKDVGPLGVWLAGHSLGAAIASLAGKNMAKRSINLTTFLYSPPYASLPLERIENNDVKRMLQTLQSFITAGLAVAIKGCDHNSDILVSLSSWMPNIFVNSFDDTCSGFIGHFEKRQMMEEIGFGDVGRLATQTSIRDLFSDIVGRNSESSQLILSANLTVNMCRGDFITVHSLNQWFKSDLNLQVKKFIYK